MGNKLSVEKMQEIAASHEGYYLSQTYINNRTKSKWKCAQGHEWETTASSIINGNTWCPICRKKEGGKKRSLGIKFMKEFAKSQGGFLI